MLVRRISGISRGIVQIWGCGGGGGARHTPPNLAVTPPIPKEPSRNGGELILNHDILQKYPNLLFPRRLKS